MHMLLRHWDSDNLAGQLEQWKKLCLDASTVDTKFSKTSFIRISCLTSPSNCNNFFHFCILVHGGELENELGDDQIRYLSTPCYSAHKIPLGRSLKWFSTVKLDCIIVWMQWSLYVLLPSPSEPGEVRWWGEASGMWTYWDDAGVP